MATEIPTTQSLAPAQDGMDRINDLREVIAELEEMSKDPETVFCACCAAGRLLCTHNIASIALESLSNEGKLRVHRLDKLVGRGLLVLAEDTFQALARIRERANVDLLRESVYFSPSLSEAQIKESVGAYVVANLIAPWISTVGIEGESFYTPDILHSAFVKLIGGANGEREREVESNSYYVTPVQLEALFFSERASVPALEELLKRERDGENVLRANQVASLEPVTPRATQFRNDIQVATDAAQSVLDELALTLEDRRWKTARDLAARVSSIAIASLEYFHQFWHRELQDEGSRQMTRIAPAAARAAFHETRHLVESRSKGLSRSLYQMHKELRGTTSARQLQETLLIEHVSIYSRVEAMATVAAPHDVTVISSDSDV